MRAVIVQHEEHEGEGLFGPALEQHGLDLVHRFRRVEPADAEAGLVVVLGGSMTACPGASQPFLDAELALLQERLRRGAPCLCICLGAQLLARAAGATVRPGARGLEIGALPVRWTRAAQRDPVTAAGTATTVVAQWHEDTFTAVPGATLLASSDAYEQQAFRLGASYAFQFHLELTTAAFVDWIEAARPRLEAHGRDCAALLAGIPAMRAGDAARQALVARLAAHFAAARCG
ncbi:MAG TPA: type 1 glutamine amidotransferase [Planctomycetota bacterium]|nr:type 1 glutamine amidotransferase [Planctomycetota bacterium]